MNLPCESWLSTLFNYVILLNSLQSFAYLDCLLQQEQQKIQIADTMIRISKLSNGLSNKSVKPDTHYVACNRHATINKLIRVRGQGSTRWRSNIYNSIVINYDAGDSSEAPPPLEDTKSDVHVLHRSPTLTTKAGLRQR